MGLYARQQTTTTTPTPPTTPTPTPSPPTTTSPPVPPTTTSTTATPPPPPTTTGDDDDETTTTTSSTTSSSSSTTTSSSSSTINTLPTSTSTSTAVVTVGPSITPTAAPPREGGGGGGFFDNKGAVIATFTVVGIAVLIFAFFVTSNIIRRRRARKFDQEVASAAAEAYADADRARSWADEDDHWNEGNSRYGQSTTTGHTQGSYGAYSDPPMSQVPPPVAPYYNYGSNGSEEFPTRANANGAAAAGGVPGQQYPYNSTDPFRDPRAGFSPGSIVPGNFSGVSGVAGVGAGGVARAPSSASDYRPSAASIKHPFANIAPVESGISYDSGPYPVPPHRARSIRQGSVPTPGRSPSMSSGGHSLSQNSSNSGQPPAAQAQRLPRTTEDQDESPYDGVSELPNPHDIPRALRVANA